MSSDLEGLLYNSISNFDGTNVTPLRKFYQHYQPYLGPILTGLCESHELLTSRAASWLIKALAETDKADGIDFEHVFVMLETIQDWATILHLLQCVQYVPDAARSDQLQPLLDHPKTLVRVWALDGYVRVALSTGECLEEARTLVRLGLDNPAASYRARARLLFKLFG